MDLLSRSDLLFSTDQNDFTPITNQVVTFQAGETERTVDFTSLPDDTSEGTENLTAVLSNPSARAMIGPQGTAMINITDDAGKLPRFLKYTKNIYYIISTLYHVETVKHSSYFNHILVINRV